jgi:uncharacterized protein (DUF362 family)/ferredoxin
MPKLAIILLDDYRPDELSNGFQTAFAELGLDSLFHPGEKILIKPNLLAAVAPEMAVTPHPSVFYALSCELLRLKVNLAYGDSPATDLPEKAARVSGYAAVAAELNISLADFINKQDQHLLAGRLLKRLPLAKGVLESDGLVSLAKLKTHALTGLTGVIKNLFGVIPGPRKAVYHANYPDPAMFCQMLVDIVAFIKPRLYVLDAIISMEGNGPRNGIPRKVGAILLSADPVSVDAAAAFLIGVEPGTIITNRLAASAGLGEINLSLVDAALIRPGAGTAGGAAIQRGTAVQLLERHRVRNFDTTLRWQTSTALMAAIGTPLLKRFILNRPVIDIHRCTHCGACISSCPLEPKAMRQETEDAQPAYDYQRCIRCYCCQEICPSGAIDIRRSLVGKILHT